MSERNSICHCKYLPLTRRNSPFTAEGSALTSKPYGEFYGMSYGFLGITGDCGVLCGKPRYQVTMAKPCSFAEVRRSHGRKGRQSNL
jgi:hypothetical protein